MTLKLIKAGVATLALRAASLAAGAAELPVKAPIYKAPLRSVVSYYNWTGFYAGINAGYGFGTSTWSLLSTGDIKPKGVVAGGTLGYNWQLGSFVYGIEGDFDWSGVKGSVTCVSPWSARPRTAGSRPSAAGSDTHSTGGCLTSRVAAPTAPSRLRPAFLRRG
jgi:hypothetical protein